MDSGVQGASPPAEPPDERRHLTVLFSDLVGSTELTASLDPEDYHDLIELYQERISAVVGEHGGVVSQFQGDGMVAYFGYPEAYESSSRDAVAAGLEIVESVRTLADALPAELNQRELQARAGIHTGTTVVAAVRVGGVQRIADLFGELPNLAARLQAAGSPGQVIVSDTTAELVAGYFELESLGALELKGIARRVPTFQVLRRNSARSRLDARPLSRFIPRTDASAWLHQQWETVHQGPPKLVLLTGEPGIGKSRLLREFGNELTEHGHAAPIAYCTRRDALSPLQPFGSLMGQVPVNPAAAALWVGAQASLGPALFVVEDVHWADPSTLEAAELVARNSRPVLVVLTARPEVSDNPLIRPAEQLTLDRLNPDAARAVVAGVPGADALSDIARDLLIERAEGVPLFLEELTRGMVEHTNEESDGAVPVTLSEVITARLDRLGEAKRVAQLAAIVGRTFDRSTLLAISDLDEAALDSHLRRLVEHAVVTQAESSEDELWFRHALIHEAAYSSVMRPLRRQAHSRVGEAFLASGRAEHQPELVAFHLGAAGRASEAVEFWRQASRAARHNSRYREASSHERELLALLPQLPEADRDSKELAARNRLILCLAAVDQSSPEVATQAVRIHELALRQGEYKAMLLSYMVLLPWWQANGEYAALESALPEAKAWAARLDDQVTLGMLERIEGTVHIWQGRVTEGLGEIERSYDAMGLGLEKSLGGLGQLPSSVVLITAAPRAASALGCWLAGRVDLARRVLDDVDDFVTAQGVPQAQAVAAATAAIVSQLDGDHDTTDRRALIATEVGDEVTTRQWKQWGVALRWWAGRGTTEPEPPPAFLRAYFLLLLADDPRVAPGPALELLDEALDTARAATERFCEPEILRVRARTLSRLGQQHEAAACLASAIELARDQGSVMLEVKALTDRIVLGADGTARERLRECLSQVGLEAPSLSVGAARRALEAAG